MREPQLTVNELLRRTDDIGYLLDIVVNGHPSLDEDHFCWDALKELEEMNEDLIIAMYEQIHV